MSTQSTVSVSVELLREVAGLVHCEADGLWCATHDAKPWPCPLARLKRYVPEAAS